MKTTAETPKPVTLEIGGTTYTLVLNTDAMIAVEEHFSTLEHEVTWDEAYARVLKGSVRAVQALIWAMLRTHHSTITFKDTARLIDEAGGFAGLAAVIEKTASRAPVAAKTGGARAGAGSH